MSDVREIERLSIPTKAMKMESLLASAREINSKCEDFFIKNPSENIRFNNDLSVTFTSEGRKYNTSLTHHSLAQLCTKLDMPVRYAKKCIEKGETDLLCENINTWLGQYKPELLLRTYGRRIRGVLSNKYSILDSDQIIQAFDEVMSEELKVKSYFLNEERFHARLILPNMLKVPDEDLFAGVSIDSSDVGRNNLVARLFIYKQICTNGMVVSRGSAELFKQKHIGISSEDFKSGLEKGIEKLPDLVAGITQAIVDSTKRNLTTKEMEKLIEVIKEEKSLSDEASKKVIELTTTKYGRSQWGVLNSITEIAQNYTLERRLELETYCGDLLVA